MKKLLLASGTLIALALASPAFATVVCDNDGNCAASSPRPVQQPQPPIVVPVPVPPPPPPSLGWIAGRFIQCNGQCYVNVPASGANVRQGPGGQVFAALVNGVPVTVLQVTGYWAEVAPNCALGQTGVWSDTAGVPLLACQ